MGLNEFLLSGLDAVAHLAVFLLVDAVFADALEPVERGIGANGVDQVGGGGTKCPRGCIGKAPFPFGAGQVKDAFGQVSLVNEFGVEIKHARRSEEHTSE